jgi:hypothetical protein
VCVTPQGRRRARTAQVCPLPLLTRDFSFWQVGAYALGPMGGRLIEVFVCCTQLGVCAIFFDFCSINLHAVFPNVSPQVRHSLPSEATDSARGVILNLC